MNPIQNDLLNIFFTIFLLFFIYPSTCPSDYHMFLFITIFHILPLLPLTCGILSQGRIGTWGLTCGIPKHLSQRLCRFSNRLALQDSIVQ